MPAITISKRTVDQATPGDRDTFLWDDQIRGFGLKVTPAGAKVYICQYRNGGRGTPTKRVTIGRHGPLTPDQARRKAKAILGDVAAGRDPAGEKRATRQEQKAPKNTVRAVAKDWLRRDQANNRRVAEVQRILDHDILPVWGDRPIAEIRKRDVIELIDGIADRGSPVMANRTLAAARRLLNWAAGRDIIEANPAAFVEKPGEEIRRDRVLEDHELVEIWRASEAAGFPFGDGTRLLILTLGRRDEIFRLAEPEIEIAEDGATIRLPAERVKNAEGHDIPLSAPALEILAGLPEINPGVDEDGAKRVRYLLSLSGKTPYSNFGWAKADLDRRILEARLEVDPDAKAMPAWRLHDIRRTGATGLQRLGFRLEVIEATLGHVAGSRAGVAGVYQRHRFAAEVRQALDAWGRHVEALVTGQRDNVVAMNGRRYSSSGHG
jgi:integrase